MKYDRHFPIAITYDSDQDNNYHRMIKLVWKNFFKKIVPAARKRTFPSPLFCENVTVCMITQQANRCSKGVTKYQIKGALMQI